MLANRSPAVQVEPSGEDLRERFLKWQCRVRQIAMRQAQGRPDAGMTPGVWFGKEEELEPHAYVITILNKRPEFSKLMEIQHMARSTHDPAQRRKEALRFFSEMYFQNAQEFSDTLTATFSPDSKVAAALLARGVCELRFEQFSQNYTLKCHVSRLEHEVPLFQATFWHNMLFNPAISLKTIILSFHPDWSLCTGYRIKN